MGWLASCHLGKSAGNNHPAELVRPESWGAIGAGDAGIAWQCPAPLLSNLSLMAASDSCRIVSRTNDGV